MNHILRIPNPAVLDQTINTMLIAAQNVHLLDQAPLSLST
jgi:hypothetical protein